jgi:hypothetical protein
MCREVCGDEESFIRGVTSAHFDDGELSTDFFEGKAKSVSRLCVANEEESATLLKAILTKSGSNAVWRGHATFEHSRLKTETAEYVGGNKALRDAKFKIWVEADPRIENPGHAEVMPKVSRGLAHHLMFKIDFFLFHFEKAA